MKPALLALLLAGCATPASQWLLAEDAQGNMSRVLHLDGVPCPTAISAAPDTAGCYYNGPVVFTGGIGESLEGGRQTRTHELEHHAGLEHGQWHNVGRDKCALVRASGRTRWTTGWLLCRGAEGYYQFDPKPIVEGK